MTRSHWLSASAGKVAALCGICSILLSGPAVAQSTSKCSPVEGQSAEMPALAFEHPVAQPARTVARFNLERRNPVSGALRPHYGLDFDGEFDDPIFAAADGVVRYRATWGGYGRIIIIDHANGVQTRYAHLESYADGLEVGERVQAGQLIGGMGSPGNSSGIHLHFEIRHNCEAVDPTLYLPK